MEIAALTFRPGQHGDARRPPRRPTSIHSGVLTHFHTKKIVAEKPKSCNSIHILRSTSCGMARICTPKSRSPPYTVKMMWETRERSDRLFLKTTEE